MQCIFNALFTRYYYEINKYDYIILGGGCSGLSLAYHLNIANKLNNKKLCIVEKRKNYQRDKIWSFWNFEDTQFNDCKLNTWKSFRLRNNNKETIVNCEKVSLCINR